MSAIAAIQNPKSQVPQGRKAGPALRGLYAEWHKLSPGISGPEGLDERGLRLWYTNKVLRFDKRGGVNSWKELTQGQARRLLRAMREDSGDGPAYRALRIGELACELWGGRDWDDFLRTRLWERFRRWDPRALIPAEAHSMMEELLSRIARRDEIGIEDVRQRFLPQGAQRKKVAQGPSCSPKPPGGGSLSSPMAVEEAVS